MTYSKAIELYEKILRVDLSKYFTENYDDKNISKENYKASLYCNDCVDDDFSVKKIISLHLEYFSSFKNLYMVPIPLMYRWVFDINDDIIKSNIIFKGNIHINDEIIRELREELENNGETFMSLKYGREIPNLEYLLFTEKALNEIFNITI